MIVLVEAQHALKAVSLAEGGGFFTQAGTEVQKGSAPGDLCCSSDPFNQGQSWIGCFRSPKSQVYVGSPVAEELRSQSVGFDEIVGLTTKKQLKPGCWAEVIFQVG